MNLLSRVSWTTVVLVLGSLGILAYLAAHNVSKEAIAAVGAGAIAISGAAPGLLKPKEDP